MFQKMKFLVAVLLVSAVCTGSVRAELIAYWPFEEGGGTATADITGKGNNGTLASGIEWVDGYNGGGVRFDTAGERIVVGPIDPSAGTNAMTLAAWIFWEGQGHTIAHQGIIGKRLGWTTTGDTIKWFWEATPANGLLFRADYSGGGTGLWWGNTYLEPYAKEWTHVALTWNNGAATQYINAAEVSTGNITFRESASATPVTIGCVDSTNNETFVGIIDEARIYNNALSPEEIQTIMLGIFPTAYSPDPADGAIHEETWVTISWKPGTLAVSHDVYLGDNFDDVDNGTGDTFRGNQMATFYVAGFPGFAYPEGLVPGTTYYWRIDEVNDAEPDSPWKGEVWSFTIPSKTAFDPKPADGAESVALDAKLSWRPGFNAILHYVYFGDSFETVNNATGAAPRGTTTFNPGPMRAAKTYYWRVDEFDAVETHKGDVWSFTTIGAVAGPNPANNATGVEPTSILTWNAGYLAASHDVYFGTDSDAVKNATKASPEYKVAKPLGDESYDPGLMQLETTYYWRIDAVNNAEPDSPWAGNVWNFTTGNYFVVDDFESYNDIDPPDPASKRIFDSWIDGFGTTDNGALVGNDFPPYAEQTVVNNGGQSMPYRYDNNGKNSEAVLNVSTRDWTADGVSELVIWFHGLPASVGSFVESPAGTYTMTGSGADIWNQADEFHFAYKTLTGAGSIVARVQSVSNTNGWAKAGVMIRETLDPGSKHAFGCITPANGVASQGRTITDTDSFSTNETGITAPHWVKLERDIGGNFTVTHSANGTDWVPVTGATSNNITMSSNVYIGLALTSHNAGSTCQAVFTNVTTTGNVTGQWMNQDIGISSNSAEPLYVAVSNTSGAPAVVANSDPAASTIDAWTEWRIPLQTFADKGINLTNVDKIAIGLGSKSGMPSSGGSGAMYFDDIRLSR